MLKNSLQTKQCDSYKKEYFFQKKKLFYNSSTICVMVCVYFLPWYVHTLQFVGVCTLGFQRHKWKFSNSAIQTFLDRLFCISQWKSVWERGNWSVQTFLVFVLYLYLCILIFVFVFVQSFICICENLYLYCICANLYLYLCKLVFVFVFVQIYICVNFYLYLCNLVFVFFSQWKSVWNRGNCFLQVFIFSMNLPAPQCNVNWRPASWKLNKTKTEPRSEENFFFLKYVSANDFEVRLG